MLNEAIERLNALHAASIIWNEDYNLIIDTLHELEAERDALAKRLAQEFSIKDNDMVPEEPRHVEYWLIYAADRAKEAQEVME